MRAVRLHEIREPAGAADARDGGDFFVPHLALFNQFEIQREHGKIAAARTPRRMIGGDFFFGQALAFPGQGGRGNGGDVSGAFGNFGQSLAHMIWLSVENYSLRNPADTLVLARSRISFTFQVRPSVLLMPLDFGIAIAGAQQPRQAGRNRKGLRRSFPRRARG